MIPKEVETRTTLLKLFWRPNYCPNCGFGMNTKSVRTGLCSCGYRTPERIAQDAVQDYSQEGYPDRIVLTYPDHLTIERIIVR